MRHNQKILLRRVFLAGVFLSLVSGCRRSPRGEGETPGLPDHIGRGRAFYKLGEYRRAEEMFHKALVLNPEIPKAYLRLGILYDDNLGEKDQAAAYYREFLKREPDSEMAGRVREWLAKIDDLPGRPAPPPPPVREAPPPPPVREASPPAVARPVSPSPPVSVRRPPTPPPPRPAATAAETYTVRGGDTLAGIARRVYGDPGAWERIFAANRDRMDSPHSLRVGQELIIPR